MVDSPVLVASGLRKSFGEVAAVRSFDIGLPAGTVLGFLGPNGAGKTTVIRMLSTVLAPDGGTFSVEGVPASDPRRIRRLIGVLPESAGYPRGQTGEEWLRFHAELFGQGHRAALDTAHRLLREVGLADRGRTRVSTYSRGMRQRLGVARALVNDPRLVILDEPTLGLDPSGQVELLELISRIAHDHGVTVILCTHLLDEVEQTCDRALIMHRGRVVADGTVEEVVRQGAAPRKARIQVPPGSQMRAARLLTDVAHMDARTIRGHSGTDVELTTPAGASPEEASALVLTVLEDAGIPVHGWAFETGRLSEAFLSVTEES